jgi:threonine synthase
VVKYFSSRGHQVPLEFKDLILSGLAPDNGLYMPDSTTVNNFSTLNIQESSYEDFVKKVFVSLDIASESFLDGLSIYPGFENSATPNLIQFEHSKFVMELFHGPTKSFKDYALQPLGSIADNRLESRGERGLVVVATSGDTGSAAIQAVKDSKSIDIVVLHPFGKVSEYQRKQMTTVIQRNVLNIAVEGSYDDCQRIAKELLSEGLENRRVISLNSINWLRVMGQFSYYVWLAETISEPFNVSIPSGNFGNAYSAWFARKLGFPIENIYCASNINDVLHRFINSGTLSPKETLPSVAPSMDIQIPSSLERLVVDLFSSKEKNNEFYKSLSKWNEASLDVQSQKILQSVFFSSTYDDHEIIKLISDYYKKNNYIFDPHSATAVSLSEDSNNEFPTVAVATASPKKFSETVKKAIENYEEATIDKVEKYTKTTTDINSIKDQIISIFN